MDLIGKEGNFYEEKMEYSSLSDNYFNIIAI